MDAAGAGEQTPGLEHSSLYIAPPSQAAFVQKFVCWYVCPVARKSCHATSELSDAAIIEAGQRLQAAGKAINGWSLRSALGSKGNPKRDLTVWERHLAGVAAADTQPEPVAVALPPGVTEMADGASRHGQRV